MAQTCGNELGFGTDAEAMEYFNGRPSLSTGRCCRRLIIPLSGTMDDQGLRIVAPVFRAVQIHRWL